MTQCQWHYVNLYLNPPVCTKPARYHLDVYWACPADAQDSAGPMDYNFCWEHLKAAMRLMRAESDGWANDVSFTDLHCVQQEAT